MTRIIQKNKIETKLNKNGLITATFRCRVLAADRAHGDHRHCCERSADATVVEKPLQLERRRHKIRRTATTSNQLQSNNRTTNDSQPTTRTKDGSPPHHRHKTRREKQRHNHNGGNPTSTVAGDPSSPCRHRRPKIVATRINRNRPH